MIASTDLKRIGNQIRELTRPYRNELIGRCREVTSTCSLPNEQLLCPDETQAVFVRDYYPYLFRTAFPNIADEQMRKFAVASSLYVGFIIATDTLVDRQLEEHSPSAWSLPILSSVYQHEQAMRLWHSLFSASSRFWNYEEQYFIDYATAVFAEHHGHWDQLRPYSYAEFIRITQGKSATSKVIPAGLAFLAGLEEKIEPFACSLNEMALALQLDDDLHDWRSDYESGRWTYVLTRVLEKMGCLEAIKAGHKPDAEQVGKCLYFSGLAEQILEEAEGHCAASIQAVRNLGCPEWCEQMEHLQTKCSRLRTDLRDLRIRALMERPRPRHDAGCLSTAS